MTLEQQERVGSAIRIMLAFGRDRSDQGILAAVDDLVAEDGGAPVDHTEVLRMIATARANRGEG
jgi:hypothetical protein